MSRLCGGGQAPASSHKSWQAGASFIVFNFWQQRLPGETTRKPRLPGRHWSVALAFPGSSSACRVREPTVGARGSRGGLSSPFRKPPNCASQSFLGSSGRDKKRTVKPGRHQHNNQSLEVQTAQGVRIDSRRACTKQRFGSSPSYAKSISRARARLAAFFLAAPTLQP